MDWLAFDLNGGHPDTYRRSLTAPIFKRYLDRCSVQTSTLGQKYPHSEHTESQTQRMILDIGVHLWLTRTPRAVSTGEYSSGKKYMGL